jgi:hypothetical protein
MHARSLRLVRFGFDDFLTRPRHGVLVSNRSASKGSPHVNENAGSSAAVRLPQVGDKVLCSYTGRSGEFVKAGHMLFDIQWEDGQKEQLEFAQLAHLDYARGRWTI